MSVGGILREGNKNLTQRTLFVASSKGIQLTDDRFLRTFRIHVGFRQIWQDPNVNVREASIGYVGGELGLPQHLYLVVSNGGDAFRHTPFSFGIQLRRPNGFALSFGGIQGGTERSLSFFGGIGIRFR